MWSGSSSSGTSSSTNYDNSLTYPFFMAASFILSIYYVIFWMMVNQLGIIFGKSWSVAGQANQIQVEPARA